MGWSFLLGRIAARTAVALWRQRLGLLVGVIAIGVLSVYELTYAGPSMPSGDCADTTMAAVTRVDDETARAAYACLQTNMRNTSEADFIAQLHERDTSQGQVSRVGDQKTRNGGRIVFYTVEQQGQAVGYIVYLDPMGKVIRVE